MWLPGCWQRWRHLYQHFKEPVCKWKNQKTDRLNKSGCSILDPDRTRKSLYILHVDRFLSTMFWVKCRKSRYIYLYTNFPDVAIIFYIFIKFIGQHHYVIYEILICKYALQSGSDFGTVVFPHIRVIIDICQKAWL